MVWPSLIGSALSRYASSLSRGSTNSSRRTVLIAFSTRESVMSSLSA